MDEDGDGEDLTPFWVQSTANLRRGDRIRRGVSALFFSSGLVVFLLLVTAVFFLVFVVPSTLSFSANIFRPNSVKKSWDSLNVVLVLVAVVFGFLSRNKNEERETEKEKERGRTSYYDEFQESSIKEDESPKCNPSTPNRWNDYSTNEQKSNVSAANQWYGYSDYQAKLEQRNLSLRRNSSSYPDLREVSPTYWGYGDYQRRYYDDIYVDSGRASEMGQIHHRRHRSLEQVDYVRETPRAKTIIVDTLVSKSMETTIPSSLPPPTAATLKEDEEITNEGAATRRERSTGMDLESTDPISAPPPLEESQSPEFIENQRRTYERVARKRERSSRRRNKNVEPTAPITTPPPPPPPPPPEQKSIKSDKKRSGATGSSAKDFLNSLYHKKKKKQRQKSVGNMESLLHEAQPPLSFQIPPPSPPPPPPPPPPPSAFQNLFLSKKQKRKRTITVRLEPYPPAPPPPPRAAARRPEPTSQTAALKTRKPPKPIKMNSFDKLDEASNSGGESPLNRIPAPPPPPPPAFFRSPAWKFVVEGDYVRVNSSTSSRSGSPDPDETESDVTPSAAFQPSPLFCPSPDVNTKAESFITNFRAKLKLEKNDSMKKREPGLSSLGPRRT